MSRTVKLLGVPSPFRRRKFLLDPVIVRCLVLSDGTKILGAPGIMMIVPTGCVSGSVGCAVGNAAVGAVLVTPLPSGACPWAILAVPPLQWIGCRGWRGRRVFWRRPRQ